jgi:dTDP-glucose 4,6-dehydratase
MKILKKNIIVTGGLGFIGSNLIEFLLKKNYTVINIDRCSYASIVNNNKKFLKKKNYFFFKKNIGNEKSIYKILQKFKPIYIINLAAETHVDNSIKNPILFVKNNTFEYAIFLECIRKYYKNLNSQNENRFKILHVSTDEVYGSLSHNKKSFTEEDKFYPNSPYSASKASSDLISRAWFKTFDLPIVISNSSNNYGRYQHKEKFIPTVINSCLNYKKIPIYGIGRNIREWIHVNDHCEAILHLCKFGKIGENYNIGSNYSINNINLAKKICEILDVKIKNKKISEFKKLIKFVKDRKAHDFKYFVNIKKIKKIKWKPKIDFNEGLSQTIDWYIENNI